MNSTNQAEQMTVVIDTREQQPFNFEQFDVATITRTMATGDYGLVDLPGCVIERKSGGDLLSCIGGNRPRFERELSRMAEMDFAAIVCEAPLEQLVGGVFRGRVSPASVVGSLLAWQLRYRIFIWLCPTRPIAEKLTLRMLERYWRDVTDGKRLAEPAEMEVAEMPSRMQECHR